MRVTENREIVARDHNGSYRLDVPALPRRILRGDDGEELNEFEAEEMGELGFDSSELFEREKQSILGLRTVATPSTTTDNYLEFDVALVDMMIRHRNRQSTGEPDGRFYQFLNPIGLYQ